MTNIFPAIDIINVQCVRLTEGKPALKKVYEKTPLEMAKVFANSGAEYLHIVDLDSALNQGNNSAVIKEVIEESSLKIQVGGGIKTEKQIRELLDLGVKQVVIGSLAVKNKSLVGEWLQIFGLDKIVIAADIDNGNISINGWKNRSDETLFDFIKNYQDLVKESIPNAIQSIRFLCTDISKDGRLEGTAMDLYKEISTKIPDVSIIASGGITSLNEIQQIKDLGMYGMIIGKAIYENRISLSKIFTS